MPRQEDNILFPVAMKIIGDGFFSLYSLILYILYTAIYRYLHGYTLQFNERTYLITLSVEFITTSLSDILR